METGKEDDTVLLITNLIYYPSIASLYGDRRHLITNLIHRTSIQNQFYDEKTLPVHM